MPYTAIPSRKGQVTIPTAIREKYKISKETPLLIEDKGKGVLVFKVMHLIDHDAIEFYENDQEFGLMFKHGIDPQVLIDAVKKIDG